MTLRNSTKVSPAGSRGQVRRARPPRRGQSAERSWLGAGRRRPGPSGVGLAVAAALSLALLAPPASAEGTADLESLLSENVITTASTAAEKASTAPATSVTVSAEELRRYGIRSVAEAIDYLALGVVTSNPLGPPDVGARGVMLAGDDGKHFLVLVDGHALNDPLHGTARLDQGIGIPLERVDRIEVVVGPGSVLYGSNAMLGVINVITKDVRAPTEAHALAEYEPERSARAGAGFGQKLRLFGTDAHVVAGAEYFGRFGPDLELRELPPARNTLDGRLTAFRRGVTPDGVWGGTVERAYFLDALSGNLGLRVGDLDVSVLASSYRYGIPYSTRTTNVDFDDDQSRAHERALRVDARYRKTLSPVVEIYSRAYVDAFDRRQWVNRAARVGCLLSFVETCQLRQAGRTEWGGLEERVSLNWLRDSSLVTLVGVDGRFQRVAAKEDTFDFDSGSALAPTAGLFRGNSGQISPYAQQTWSPSRYLDVNAGARFDVSTRYSPVLSPRGAVAVSPARNTTFRAIYSQAFRAPTWFETNGSGAHRAASPNLEPEIVRSAEASAEQRIGTQRVLVGVFRSWWSDLVEPHDLTSSEVSALQSSGVLPLTASAVAQYQNVSSLDNAGYNAAWDGSLATGRFTYGVNATEAYTRRHGAAGRTPLDVAPQRFGNAHVAVSPQAPIPTVALATQYVGERFVQGRVDQGLRAPALLDFRLTVSGRVPGLQMIGYRLSAAYATAADGPYVAGPAATPPVVAPIDRFRVFVGLRWDLDADDAGGRP